MILAAATVGVIERRWTAAAAWSALAALLSACGLMHSYQWTFGDTALKLAPAWPFVDRLRRHGAALSQRGVDDRGGRRILRRVPPTRYRSARTRHQTCSGTTYGLR